MTVVDKVVCFIRRREELLVFRHRDFPDAGIQVPAGSVEDDESFDSAAVREAEEETGRRFRLVRKLGVVEFTVERVEAVPTGHEHQRCHTYELEPLDELPESWLHLAEGKIWFEYEWWPIDRIDELDQRARVCAPLLGRQ